LNISAKCSAVILTYWLLKALETYEEEAKKNVARSLACHVDPEDNAEYKGVAITEDYIYND
jgi:hypothetical protein